MDFHLHGEMSIEIRLYWIVLAFVLRNFCKTEHKVISCTDDKEYKSVIMAGHRSDLVIGSHRK